MDSSGRRADQGHVRQCRDHLVASRASVILEKRQHRIGAAFRATGRSAAFSQLALRIGGRQRQNFGACTAPDAI